MDLNNLNNMDSNQIFNTITDSVTKAPNLDPNNFILNNVVNPLQNVGNTVQKFANRLDVPLPKKKTVTFFLQDENGNLANVPEGLGLSPGYQFTLLINPSTFKIVFPQKVVNQVRTMGGWVLQHWYPEIGTITADGIIGNLLQRYNSDVKQTSKWEAFKKLITVYQNNGIPYQVGPIKRVDKTFNPTAVCVYDQVTYYGYFENFEFDENQDQPWTRNYSFTFRYLDLVDTTNIAERTNIVGGTITSFTNNLTKGIVGQSAQALSSIATPFTQE